MLIHFSLIALLCLLLAVPAFAQQITLKDGKPRRYSQPITLSDAINHRWEDELVTYTVDFPPKQATLNSIRVYDVDHAQEIPCQLSETKYYVEKSDEVKSAKVSFFIDELPAMGTRKFLVLWDSGKFTAPMPDPQLKDTNLAAETIEVSNGLFGVRLAGGEKHFDPPADAAGVPGPLRGFCGPDGVWRGISQFRTDAKLLGWKTALIEQGPLWKTYRVHFDFDQDRYYELELKMLVNHPYAYVTDRNNFRIRLAQMAQPHPRPAGWMGHGDSYICWGVADQLHIQMGDNFDPDMVFTSDTMCTSFPQDPIKHDKVRVWTAVRPVFSIIDGAWFSVYSTDPAKNDMVGLVGRDGTHWEYPDTSTHPYHTIPGVNAEIYFNDSPEEHAFFRLPIARAVRHWLLAVGDKREWTKLAYPGNNPNPSAPYLAHLRATVCDLPLDKVKDWHLDWEQRLPKEPRLYFSPDQKDALLARLQAHEPFKPYLKDVGPLTGAGAANMNSMHEWVEKLLRIGYAGDVGSISLVRPQRVLAEAVDLNAAFLDPQKDAGTRRDLAFLNSVVLDRDYWQYAWNPGRTSYLPNFNSDLYIAAGITALVLPDHPNSKQWLDYSLNELQNEFSMYTSPDGTGEENVGNYYWWSWWQLSHLVGAFKQNDVWDAGKDPRYQAACRFWIDVLSPPQYPLATYWSPNAGKPEERLRRIPPIGNHGGNDRVFSMHGVDAGILKDDNPQLAGESAWAWREASGARPETWFNHPYVEATLLLSDPTVAPKVPVLASKPLEDFGAILRNHFPSDKETYLAFKCGRVYSHHDQDEGTIHLFGRGVPIILDALHPDDGGSESLHSLVSFAGGGMNRRGAVTDFWSSPLVDSVVGNIPPGNFYPGSQDVGVTKNGWRRQILLVKSPTLDVPDYFVLYDRVFGPEASQFNLAVMSPQPQLGVGGNPGWLQLPALDSPNHGVTTDLVFLAPTTPQVELQQVQGGQIDACYNWVIHAKQPAGMDWSVLLYPRDKGMAAPRLETLGSSAVKLTSPDGLATDYVVAAAGPVSAQTETFRFDGQSGIARVRDGRVSLALIDGVEMRCQEIGINGKGPVYLEQTADGFRGSADGAARRVYLFLGKDWTSDLLLTLNGKPEKLNSPNGILTFMLPDGHCEFSIGVP